MKTKRYKVIVTCGSYDAPSIYLETIDDKTAIKLAREKSGLSRFDNWTFIPKSY